MFEVRKAKRSRRPIKTSIEGLSGSGKTCTALRLAHAMLRAGIAKRLVVADSENGRAESFAGSTFDGQKWDFEHCPIPRDSQNPSGYTQLYRYLVNQGFDLIVIDSMSHAWHGALEEVDRYAASAGRNDKFSAWSKVTPEHREMIQTLTDTSAHLIATMRVKSDYAEEIVNGKKKFVKLGMKADQRDNTEYEFDVVVRMLDHDHNAVVEKASGCDPMDGRTARKPGPDFWQPLFDWWLSADPVVSEDERLTAKLRGCNTAAELAAAWGKLSPQQMVRLLAVKDARKAELTATPLINIDGHEEGGAA